MGSKKPKGGYQGNPDFSYNDCMPQELPAQEFRPQLLSRRGELIAWSLAILVMLTWVILVATGKPVQRLLPFLAIVLLFAGMGISLSNWMDRHSLIHLDPESVTFDNGLRHTHLKWDEIRQVQVFPSSWGDKVRVIGEHSYFEFRTLGEVKVQGEVKGRMGFSEGDKILKRILEMAGLRKVAHSGGGEYYARE